MTEREALKLALEALEWINRVSAMDYEYQQKARESLNAIYEALAEQPAPPPECQTEAEKTAFAFGWFKALEMHRNPTQQQKEEFASPGGGYVPAIPRPVPLDWKLVPRKATPEMLKAMDECAQEGYDERLYEGMASSVYMAAWDASPVLGTLPTSKEEMSMMDMIVGNLVREGINKHRARELAEHFIKQCNYTNGYCTGRTDLLAEQKAQQPVAWMYDVARYGPDDLRGQQWRPAISRIKPHIHDRLVRDMTPLYTSPPASKPLTDEQFLELVLREGTVELVNACTFVGGSIQMQGRMGLLRSAKIIKEFVEAAHGIKGEA